MPTKPQAEPVVSMDKNIKRRWLRALRSGKYRQGKSQLRTERDSFCCLGVLCDIAAKDGVVTWRKNDEGWYVGNHENKTLPPSVVKWAKIKALDKSLDDYGRRQVARDPDIAPGQAYTSASDVNDNGLRFPRIADLIEKNIKGI